MKRVLVMLCLLLFIAIANSSETIRLEMGNNSLSVISSNDSENILQYKISEFEHSPVSISGQEYSHIRLSGEGITQDKGYPELPVFNRSIVIANNSLQKLEIYDVQYQDMRLAIAPSKGIITRNIDPETVPYSFELVYQSDKFYPAQMAELSDPYILRDFRGITIKTSPFAYNPATQTLRIYTSYKIRVYADGTDRVNTLSRSQNGFSREFAPIYENHFVNWQNQRYTSVSDAFGKMLVICHTNYLSQIAPYVNWKKQKGINTELVEWSTIGTTAAQLQTYIQNRYNTDNTIAYIQLVGDAPQIPTLSSGGGGSDPTFALVAGTDNYPDIFIGRFSAETIAQVTTQVNKAIIYERDATTGDTWLSKALGIASAEGGGSQGDNGESDIVHMNGIRTDLLGYGYSTVDQVYDPGALAATVTTNVNTGRGFINYVGHGSDTSWVTTGFSSTNATALTNGTKTPFIMDVACVNGNFVSITCFAEAWMRNANGGSVAMYASTINQSWNSPMLAQDEATDLLIADAKTTAGGLYYNASCKMMDTYGNTTGSDGVNMYKTWHIFGDASLMLRTKTPLAMTVTHPATFLIGSSSVTVNTGVANARVAITYNNTIYGVAIANSSGAATVTLSNAPTGVVTYTVTVTAFNRVSYVGSMQQIAGTGPYMSVLTTTYADSNNNVAEYNESGRFNVTYKNVGSETATNVATTLTCATSGITLTDNTESIASLAANASTTINNAYGFNIANNVANGTSASFTITMVEGSETWTHNFSQTINAPALALGSMTISDPAPGNNNGRLDPGETVTITMPLGNTGAATSTSGSATLTSPTSGITINTGTANFAAISASGSSNLSFSITAASGMTIGTVASFVFNATAGAYTTGKTETSTVGIIMENFETGSFNSFPWIQGASPWTIVNTGAYAGTYAAKSGTITSSGSTTVQTTRILSSSGSLSFYYKVSSESTYDYLKFYIDGTLQNSWSGEVAWTQATYTLAAGTRVLKWEYMKDGSVDSGSDCAWIDNIIFPASTAPSSFYPPQNLAAAAGNGVVNLSWQAPATGSPTGYKIFKDSALLTTITTLSYSDTAVTNGTSYGYYLKAVYSGGESDATSTVSAIPSSVVISEVTIGSGTSVTSTSTASPINIYYESLHGQSVYTATELNAAGMIGAQNITRIGFYISSVPSLALPNFVIRMKHTADTTVANWQTATDMQTVYTSSSYMPVAGGYHMITLNTPFAWNGTGNLVVDTAFGTLSTWTSTGTVQYSTVTNGYRFIRLDDVNQTEVFAGGSTSSNRPNIRLSFLPVQTDVANISVSPGSVTQTVNTGASTTTQITISNTGTADLNWSSSDREELLRTNNQFDSLLDAQRTTWLSFSPSSGTIPAGGNTVLTLILNSAGLANNTYNKNLVIASNATNNPSLSIPVSFTVSDLIPNQPRFVAEWEPAQGAIIRYPLGLPYTLIADLSNNGLLYVLVSTANQSACNTALSGNSVNMTNVRYINADTDSYWVRDFGPWTIFDANNVMKIVDFPYNRPRPNDDAAPIAIANYLGTPYYTMSVSHTGGNIMTDGQGKAMSTQLVLEENTSLSQAQINEQFQTYLGISEYQLYPDPNNTYIDHIDCWAKLLDVDKVMIRSVGSSHAQYSAIEAVVNTWRGKTSSYGTPYKIYRVYTPNDEPYSNAYILNKRIYVPQMGTANDAAALLAYRNAMPGYTVTGYSYSTFESTDALHCRVNTVFDAQMVSVRHTPPTSAQATVSLSLPVSIAHTNAVNTSSSYVSWKTGSNGVWQNSSLVASGNVWSTSITAPALGDTIFYWIKATDSTNRSVSLPLCAGDDPFRLVVNIPAPNVAPAISLPESLSFNKNGSLNHSFASYISDANGDALTLVASGNTNISVQIVGSEISFSATDNWIGSENITFTVSDGVLTATDVISVAVLPVNVPDWDIVDYGTTPAMLYAVVTVNNIPASVNDIIAAFVGDECRGMGTINLIDRSTAHAEFEVNLASTETVNFKIYAYQQDTVYPVQDVMPMVPGQVYGETVPVPLNGTTNLVIAAPSVNLQSSLGTLRISWNAVPHADNYKVLACSQPDGSFLPVGNTTSLYWEIDASAVRMFYKVVAEKTVLTK